jgi:elongation factor 1 alpha-like protein
MSTPNTPTQKKGGLLSKKSGSSTPVRGVDPRYLDLSALNLTPQDENNDAVGEEPPKMSFAREKLIEEARRVIEANNQNQKKGVSLVVIGMCMRAAGVVSYCEYYCLGHVDAGKSTLMGRLLYELGRLDEKARIANERGSSKAGKSSFSWAWGLDGTAEERERYEFPTVFMDGSHYNTEGSQWILLCSH